MKIELTKGDIERLLIGKELIIMDRKEYYIYARLERKKVCKTCDWAVKE